MVRIAGPRWYRSTGWVISRDKGSGVQPGFRMTDPAGQLYQIEVDPPANPEMATGAEMIGTAFYHAFGYHTVEVSLTEFAADALVISEKATIRDAYNGKRRPFTRRDLDDVLRRAARQPNGKYRALVSRFAAGRPLGNFRYYGTRPDDPNDIVPHEHRRELRAARVFGAWLNHDDSRGVNSLDMLEPQAAGGAVKHYMFDFGSILGSGTVFAQARRAGHEYIFEHAPGWRTLATLGFTVRPWMRIDYPDVPASVGRFEGDALRTGVVEAGVSERRVRKHAAGRCVLGRANRVAFHQRGDPRHRREGALLGSEGDRLHHRRRSSSGATRCCAAG